MVIPPKVDPACLFGLLWPLVEPHASEIIQEPWDVGACHEYDLFYGLLVEHDGDSVPQDFLSYLEGEHRPIWRVPKHDVQKRAFVVMRAIDRAFRYVLPDAAYIFHGSPGATPGVLMRRMRDVWLSDGCLAEVAAGHVALLGPLTGPMRADAPDTRNGDLFEHQFINITVVPPLDGGRRLTFRTLAPSDFTLASTTEEKVGVAPIAQDHDDLTFRTEKRGHTCYIDARPTDSTVIAARTVNVVSELLGRGARLIALPELVLNQAVVEKVLTAIRKGAHDGGRIIVLGSGLTDTAVSHSGLAFNEAVITDGRGRVLIRQRKLNHYAMSPERMTECAITPEGDVPHVENSASGTELCVCDLPGIGRLMVLICEDFAQEKPGRHAAQMLSPDWIVTPVLDLSVSPGRWTHQKSFSLGTVSKIVVSGSTTLSVRKARCENLQDLDQSSGVAMLYDGGAMAAGRIVTAGCMIGTDRAALIDWSPGTWGVSELKFRPRPEEEVTR